jgi:hypothetical protein
MNLIGELALKNYQEKRDFIKDSIYSNNVYLYNIRQNQFMNL